MLIDWLVEAVCGLQQKGEDLVLATVLKKSGSAPCLAGSKMIVRSDGTSVGSVGGGALEAGALKFAEQIFKTRTARIMRFNLTGADAASMQMICGGQVEVLVEHIPCTPVNIEVFRALQSALADGEKCYLIADLGQSEVSIDRIGRCVAWEDGSIAGEFPFQPDFLDSLKGRAFSSAYPVVVYLADRRNAALPPAPRTCSEQAMSPRRSLPWRKWPTFESWSSTIARNSPTVSGFPPLPR